MVQRAHREATGVLQKYVDELLRIFKAAPSKHAAHERSRQVLLDMAGDPACLRATIEHEIRKPGALNTKHFPTVGLTIKASPYFGLVANCFLPQPSGEVDLTVNSIHHHGHLLLTTVTTFGPGYEHWRFTTPKAIDAERDLFAMDIVDRGMHSVNHVAFVDSYMPHAVMTPASLTVTFALWSSQHSVTWRDHAKRMKIFEGKENKLRDIFVRVGLTKALSLNKIEYFDYFPTGDGFKGMRQRIQFKRGPNDDFLYSLFHVMQQTKNESLARVVEEQLGGADVIENPGTIRTLIREISSGRPIESRMTKGLHRLDHMNFKALAIEQALSAQRRSVNAVRDIPAQAAG